MTKEKNSFDTTVEMMADMGADSILVRSIDDGLATGCPYDSKTGTSWALDMVSSIEELKACKYLKAVPEELVKKYEESE